MRNHRLARPAKGAVEASLGRDVIQYVPAGWVWNLVNLFRFFLRFMNLLIEFGRILISNVTHGGCPMDQKDPFFAPGAPKNA